MRRAGRKQGRRGRESLFKGIRAVGNIPFVNRKICLDVLQTTSVTRNRTLIHKNLIMFSSAVTNTFYNSLTIS